MSATALGDSFDPFTASVQRAESHPVSGQSRYRVTFTLPGKARPSTRHVPMQYDVEPGSALATLTYAARALGLTPLPTSSHTAYMGTVEGVGLTNISGNMVRVTPPIVPDTLPCDFCESPVQIPDDYPLDYAICQRCKDKVARGILI